MASEEHCLVCFEALDAELNDRKPLTLAQITSSYAAFKASAAAAPKQGILKKNPALQVLSSPSLLVSSSSTSSSSSTTSLAASTAATSISPSPSANNVLTAPLFVTWNTLDSDSDPILRGCIGTFEPHLLSDGLPEYALISALQDTRFPPISPRELPTLQAAVTLLTDFEEADDPYDWTIGTHGIRLSFSDRGRRYGSTYLPDVASEQGWSHDEALFSLVRKAGWMGSRSRWKGLPLKVTRYQGKKVSLNYAEFKQWKDWAAKEQL